jgi:hypothetical protein
VNRGATKDRKSWQVGGRGIDFAGLVAALSAEAQELLARTPELDGLEVIGIDLTLRDPPKKKKRPRPGKAKGEAAARKRSQQGTKSKRGR